MGGLAVTRTVGGHTRIPASAARAWTENPKHLRRPTHISPAATEVGVNSGCEGLANALLRLIESGLTKRLVATAGCADTQENKTLAS